MVGKNKIEISFSGASRLSKTSLFFLLTIFCFHCFMISPQQYMTEEVRSLASSGRSGSRHLQQQQPFTVRKRGGNFLTTHSGCRISKWIYDDVESQGGFECNPNDIRQLTSSAMHLIDDHDTIYIPFSKLVVFGDKVLDHLAVKVVIISGLWQNGGPNKNETIQRMLNSSNVIFWFCQNLAKYGITRRLLLSPTA